MRRFQTTVASVTFLFLTVAQGAEVKVRNFTVNPSTGPLGAVDVTDDFKGAVTLTPPAGWVLEPHTVQVERVSAPFRVVKATENTSNCYLFAVEARGKTETQIVSVASAPYGKLVVDAIPDPLWNDGIPLEWQTAGKKTIVRMFWNEDNLYLAVEMEGGLKSLQYGFGFIKKNGTKIYHEFETDALGKTHHLSRSEGKIVKRPVSAKSVSMTEAGKTRCEIELPAEAIEGIRFDAGREFYFSMIVTDTDGTIRDLGERMNRPTSAKRRDAWLGVQKELFDAWSIFGCCSSIH